MTVQISMPSSFESRPLDRPAWLPESVWPIPSRLTLIKDTRIHYTDVGDGPVVALVNAGFWSFVWRDVILDLQRDFRVIALDFPSSGLSGDGPVGLESHSRVLEALLEGLGISSCTLAVHDLGGVAGLVFGARRPDMIERIVAINTFGWLPGGVLRAALRVMGSRWLRTFDAGTRFLPNLSSLRFGVGRHLDAPSRRAFRAAFRNPEHVRSLHDLFRDARVASDVEAAVDVALRGALSARPMMTIFGQFNDPLRFQAGWRQRFPNMTQVVVPHGMHFPMCDAPRLVANSIRAWHDESSE